MGWTRLLFCFFSSWSIAISDKITSLKNLSSSDSHDLLESFLQYHLYHRTFHLQHSSKEFCLLDEYLNSTHLYLEQKLQLCGNPNYFPRILSSSQVSFKKVDPEQSQTLKKTNSTSNLPKKVPRSHKKGHDLNTSHHNSTIASLNLTNATSPSTQEGQDDEDDDKTIHKYLLFVLVIPKHPFSRELIQSIQIIAPMYPTVTIYFGLSYEFVDLCAQYGVKSFPKLLFFHNGLLAKKYSDLYDPVTLALHITKWIGKFPEALPIPLSSSTQKLSTVIPSYYNYNSTWFTVPNNDNSTYSKFLISVDSFLVNISAGRSIEPLIALSPRVIRWDFEIFMVSLLYTVIRICWWIIYCWIDKKSTIQADREENTEIIAELERTLQQLVNR